MCQGSVIGKIQVSFGEREGGRLLGSSLVVFLENKNKIEYIQQVVYTASRYIQ